MAGSLELSDNTDFQDYRTDTRINDQTHLTNILSLQSGYRDEIDKYGLGDNNSDQKILCRYYDTEKDDFVDFNGTIVSAYQDSVVFDISHPLAIETPIYIEHKKPLRSTHVGRLNEGDHAEIVACEEINNHRDKARFRIHARFYNIQEDIHG